MNKKLIHILSNYPLIGGFSLIIALIVMVAGCKSGAKTEEETEQKNPRCKVEKSVFGLTPEGDSVSLYTLKNENNLLVKITDFGGIITEIHTPDRNGKMKNVVLGFDNLEQYLAGHPNFGALIGRFGNRIANARFTLDGEEYQLAVNNGPNSLHGGIVGFDDVVWDAEIISDENRAALKLSYLSVDGEEGYPGNLSVVVTYELLPDQLIISYEAETDKATVLNLTNHSYFNLSASGGNILDHILYINASKYTPVDSTLIPTGELANVEGTPFDFRKPTVIGERIQDVGGNPAGYDHNYVLDGKAGEMTMAAKAMDPLSGRWLEVSTTEPGVQFYTGNFLNGKILIGNNPVEQHEGFCLETQHFPDSPNQPDFPTTVLRPGEQFRSQTIFKFGVEEAWSDQQKK